jgi:tetratricopeptide (TPR) repeat protein
MQERAELRDALARIEALRDISARKLLFDELTDELGDDFDPPRTNALSTDCAAIVRACARLGALRELVAAVKVIAGGGHDVARLTELIERFAPEAVLTTAERRRAASLLARIPPPSIEQLLTDANLAEYWDREILDIGDALERLGARATRDAYVDVALLAFLERAAHRADNFSMNQCHQIIQNAAVRLGREEEISRLCQQLSSGEDVADRVAVPVVASSPGDRVIPALSAPTTGEADVTVAASASAPLRIIGGLPPQNPSFTGRQKEMRKLREALHVHSQAALLPQTLHGLGGVGKTQMAIEYAHRFQHDYDLIWWIPSELSASIKRSLLSLARRLELPEGDDTDLIVQRLLDELSVGRPTAKWLLIYDNAGDPNEVRTYMPGGQGQILVTSRNRDWSAESNTLEVDVFTEEESIEFLTRRWTGISDEEAHTLAEELGRLPLALDQAVAVHRVTGMPLHEYLRLLKKSPGLMLDEGESSEYPQSVAKTCRLAFARLREHSPGAAQLLEVCAFLSPSDIAVPMLIRGRGAPLPEPLAQTLLDDIKLRSAIREIGRYGLAQLDVSRDFIRVHMLVGTLLRDMLPPEQREKMGQAAHSLLAYANPQRPDDDRTWSAHRQIAPHVIPAGIMSSQNTHVLQVILDQIRFLFVTGEYRQSAELAQIAVDTWKRTIGPDQPVTLRANFHLGNALRALGEYQRARAINEETLKVMKREFGDDNEDTLRIANSYGADLRLAGDFTRALALDEETLDRYRKTLGEDDAATLRSTNNLAVDCRLLGNFRRAYQLDTGTLERRRAVLRGSSPEVLSSTSSIARDLYGIGDYQEALEEEDRSLQTYGDLFKGHMFLQLAMRNRAIILRKVGRYREAVQLSGEIAEQSRSHFGPRHEHSISAMMTLANALRVSGDLEEAEKTNDQAWQLYRENFGEEHPFTLACASNIAIIWRALDRVAEAVALDRVTSESLTRHVGRDHPYTLCALAGLSNDLSIAGDHEEARKVSQEVYDRSRRARYEDHPYTLACATNLALDLEATGAVTEAATLRADTRRRLQHTLGREHPETINMERGRRAECDTEVPPT